MESEADTLSPGTPCPSAAETAGKPRPIEIDESPWALCHGRRLTPTVVPYLSQGSGWALLRVASDKNDGHEVRGHPEHAGHQGQ